MDMIFYSIVLIGFTDGKGYNKYTDIHLNQVFGTELFLNREDVIQYWENWDASGRLKKQKENIKRDLLRIYVGGTTLSSRI